jgi:hypothetical protein
MEEKDFFLRGPAPLTARLSLSLSLHTHTHTHTHTRTRAHTESRSISRKARFYDCSNFLLMVTILSLHLYKILGQRFKFDTPLIYL